MKSLEDLKKLRVEALKKVDMRSNDKDYRIVVGMATCGIAAGARPVLTELVKLVGENDYSCVITQTGCIGLCSYEPIVEVFDKENKKTTYVHMTAEKAKRVLEEHIKNGKIVEDFTMDRR